MKFCIVGNALSQAFSGDYVGGAEKQTALLAINLSKMGHNVIGIDLSASGCANHIGDIVLIPAKHHGTYRLPVLSLVLRIAWIVRVIRRMQPNYVYVRGVDQSFLFIPALSLFSNAHRIWALAHDNEINPALRAPRRHLYTGWKRVSNAALFRFTSSILLRRADTILCQNQSQFEHLRRDGHTNISLVENMFVPTPCRPTSKSKEDYCIWVGKLCGTKGEYELLELARLLPNITIHVLGGVRESFRNTAVFQRIEQQKNIQLLGRLRHDEVLERLHDAPLMIHTAPSEGFSNAFLEAWYCRCPIVSLSVDTNDLLSSGGLGGFANGSLMHMAMHIRTLLADRHLAETIGHRAHDYVIRNHSPQSVCRKMIRALGITESRKE